MLTEKVQYLNNNITESLRQQQDRANKQDQEFQSLTAQLANLKVTYQTKLQELNNVAGLLGRH